MGTSHRIASGIACAAGLVLLLAAGPAFAAQVTKVRVGEHPTYTRVVFELDASAGYRIEKRKGDQGHELVVTLEARAPSRRLTRKTEMVSAVDVNGRGERAVARILLRKKPSRVKEMILANPPRIVFDLVLPEKELAAKEAAKKKRAAAAASPKVAKVAEPKPAKPVVKAEPAAPKPKVAKPAPKPKVAKPEPKVAKPVVKAEPIARVEPPKPKPAVEKAKPVEPKATDEPKPVARAKPRTARKSADAEAKPEAGQKLHPAIAMRRSMGKPEPAGAAVPLPKPGLAGAALPKPELDAEIPIPAPGAEPPDPDLAAAGPKPEPMRVAKPEPEAAPVPTPKPRPAAKPTPSPERVAETKPTIPTPGASPDFVLWGGVAAGVLFVMVLVVLVLRRRKLPNDSAVTAVAEEEDGDGPIPEGGFSMDAPAESVGPLFDGASDAGPISEERKRTVEMDIAAGPGLFDEDEPEKENEKMDLESQDLPVDSEMPTQVGAAPAAGGDLANLVRDLERRMAQLETRLDESTEARERLERQVAAQAEELRVQRAAIARTQRALRSLNRPAEEQATEPALRDQS
ncbi:MAG: hypothetical protein QNK04_00825 [Myxococcota bacterium]|nr:hypothetical protein [Myxococcota bacterium]